MPEVRDYDSTTLPSREITKPIGRFFMPLGMGKSPIFARKKAIFEEKQKKSHFQRKKFAKTLASSKIMRTFATEIENNLTP